ncbi:hypothetical protein [uncultured Sulfitobacter sp.]|uniref:hypothetical protein n=1 Tax=uncultured Sulfitobacter sp. TaxID=191468 RepID=UPI002619906A|nr:hypothetical protein [uncultured Sulfitobacter sp.]
MPHAEVIARGWIARSTARSLHLMRALFAFLLFTTPAHAETFTLLSGDEALERAEVIAMTANNDVAFFEGGVSRYSVGGAYSYTYANDGGTAYGRFNVAPDGLICIAFRNGRSRCDRFVRSHGRLVMITENGDRFPVRP